MQEIQIDKGIDRMIPFCALLVMIDIVWLIMDGMVRKLETEK